MNKKQKLSLVLGVLLCIYPVMCLGIPIIEYFFGIASRIYSYFSPESWLIVGMLCIGIFLIGISGVFESEIKYCSKGITS